MKIRFAAVMAAVGLVLGIQVAQAQGLEASNLVMVDQKTTLTSDSQRSTNGSLRSVERKNAKAARQRAARERGDTRGWYSLGRAIDFFNRGVPSSVVSESNGAAVPVATAAPKAVSPSAQSPRLSSSIDRTNRVSIRRIVVEGDLAGPKSDERLEEAMGRAQVIQPYVVFDDSQINILSTLLR